MFGDRRNDATSLHRQVNSPVKLDVGLRVNSGTTGVIWQRVSAQLYDSCARRRRPIECAWLTHLKAMIHQACQSTSVQELDRMQVEVAGVGENTAFAAGLASFRKIEFSAFQQAQEARLACALD
jgi:hypothetical protein